MKNQRLNKMLGIKGINTMLKLVSSKYYQNFITNHIMPAFSAKNISIVHTVLSDDGHPDLFISERTKKATYLILVDRRLVDKN